MSLLTQYREKLHLKEVVKDFHQHKKPAGDFTGMATVGILFDATDTAISQEALAFIKKLTKQAKTVVTLGFVNVKEMKEELPFDFFCKKDLDWLWRPKGGIPIQFKQQKFDLLINLSQTDCFPLEYLAVSIDANYKIGALTEYPNNYDLMLDTKSFSNYLEQVTFFLHKFSTASKEVVSDK